MNIFDYKVSLMQQDCLNIIDTVPKSNLRKNENYNNYIKMNLFIRIIAILDLKK